MNCPTCGSLLKEHLSPKGQTFLTCSAWPKCKVSGTPDLLKLFGVVHEPPPEHRTDPVLAGKLIVGVAQLRIAQAKLKAAKTKAERDLIRQQTLEALR
jgi:ssDNA-binding Zn-finger/Zn-ribbon topoisomerase 1